MSWTVNIEVRVPKDLRWFGRKEGRLFLQDAMASLKANPLEQSKNMKDLRPNSFAQRELRLMGKIRFLFNVDEDAETVTIVAVGEKSGNKLLVQGEEFHRHESDTTNGSQVEA